MAWAATSAAGQDCRVTIRPLDAELRDRYLAHLGIDDPGPPSAAALRELHRAHLDRVPYENLEIQLGRPTTVRPEESAARIVTGRGGYCYHLNGAFGALLASLGYRVTLVRGAVPDATEQGEWGNHLALLVPVDGITWLVDVGLGDGFRDPLPLQAGPVEQEPFRYRLSHRAGAYWRFDHDERSSISGFDLDVTPRGLDAFAPVHARLSTSPESPFVRVLVVQSRYADHTLTLRGCVVSRADKAGVSRSEVTDREEWAAILADDFGLRLDEADLDRLWDKARAAHEVWKRSGRH